MKKIIILALFCSNALHAAVSCPDPIFDHGAQNCRLLSTRAYQSSDSQLIDMSFCSTIVACCVMDALNQSGVGKQIVDWSFCHLKDGVSRMYQFIYPESRESSIIFNRIKDSSDIDMKIPSGRILGDITKTQENPECIIPEGSYSSTCHDTKVSHYDSSDRLVPNSFICSLSSQCKDLTGGMMSLYGYYFNQGKSDLIIENCNGNPISRLIGEDKQCKNGETARRHGKSSIKYLSAPHNEH